MYIEYLSHTLHQAAPEHLHLGRCLEVSIFHRYSKAPVSDVVIYVRKDKETAWRNGLAESIKW